MIKHRFRLFRNFKAFTLVETIMASLVLFIVAAAVASAFAVSSRISAYQNERIIAQDIARDISSKIVRFTSFDNINPYTGNNPTYTDVTYTLYDNTQLFDADPNTNTITDNLTETSRSQTLIDKKLISGDLNNISNEVASNLGNATIKLIISPVRITDAAYSKNKADIKIQINWGKGDSAQSKNITYITTVSDSDFTSATKLSGMDILKSKDSGDDPLEDICGLIDLPCCEGNQCSAGTCNTSTNLCETDTSCLSVKTDGQSCSQDCECLTGNCNDQGQCGQDQPVCKAAGETCATAADCCSGICPTNGNPANRYKCGGTAEVCNSAGDTCCSGGSCNNGLTCNSTTNKCETPQVCNSAGDTCCSGGSCNNGLTCNSTTNKCEVVNVCLPVKLNGASCAQSCECLTGNCNSQGQCGPEPVVCKTAGQACLNNAECCSGLTCPTTGKLADRYKCK